MSPNPNLRPMVTVHMDQAILYFTEQLGMEISELILYLKVNRTNILVLLFVENIAVSDSHSPRIHLPLRPLDRLHAHLLVWKLQKVSVPRSLG